MNPQLPPLKSLRHFEAVARLRSFSEAAQELGITQSAISHQVKLLEKFYQLRLFSRERHVSLTDQGKLLYHAVLQSFAHLIEASEVLSAQGRERPLLIATTSPFEPWLSDRLSFYQPEQMSRVHIVNYSLLDKFPDDEEVDMAIIFTNQVRQRGVNSQRLFSEDSVPVCETSLTHGTYGIQSIEDLQNHWLLHKRNRALWQLWFHTMAIPYPDTNKELFFRDDITLHKALHSGEGVGLLQEDEIEEGLTTPLATRIPDDFAYHLCWRGDGHPEFRSWIEQEVQQRRYLDAAPPPANNGLVARRLAL